MSDLKKSLEGKRFLGFEVSQDRQQLTLRTDKGSVIWKVFADCCSHTWIENADLEICSGVVREVRDLDLDSSKSYDWSDKSAERTKLPEMRDELQEHDELYGIEIRTDGGVGTIDFRNSSNGYYGGWMELAT